MLENRILNSFSKVSRRSFLKGLAVIGTAAGAYGCSKSDSDEVSYITGEGTDSEENIVADIKSGVAEVWSGTAGHNCGGRCVTRAVKKDGRIVRILTDESYVPAQFEDHVSNTQSRACSRCRSYVGRLYSPSRMRYPLKQTLERGNLDGFVRISWEQAMEEVAKKYAAIAKKWGSEAIYNHMSSGQQGQFQRGGGNGSSSMFAARVGPLSGGYLHQGYNYSAHCSSYFGTAFTGVKGGGNKGQHIAQNTSTAFLWGSHGLSTSNPDAYPSILSCAAIKERDGKIYYISPTLEDTGITLATDWVQINPYTDIALISAILHEMIVNTFNVDGSVANDPWLDVDYLDSMVYGFFASPAYWIDNSGSMSLTTQTGGTWRKVDEVPKGQSYADYIMGDDTRLSNALYGAANASSKINYVSSIFVGLPRGGVCSYGKDENIGESAIYYYKKDMRKAKTPAWAQGITGVPAAEITAMAKRICNESKAGKAVIHHCSNGWQRQAEGVAGLFALQNLVIISKCWGKNGSGFIQNANIFSAGYENSGDSVAVNTAPESTKGSNCFYNNVPKLPSCTMWHAGVKFAFGDVLKSKGYSGSFVPDTDMASDFGDLKAYRGDANIKSLVKHEMAYTSLDKKITSNASTRYTTVTLKDENGVDRQYFKWEEENGKAVPAGIRFIYTVAGNAIINQHMNANDTAEMLSKLPITAPDDPDGFCYIALDTNFTPTMRWADYAFPGTANWEMVDLVNGAGGAQQIYMPATISGPGESKSGYELNRLLARYLGKVDSATYGVLANQFDNGKTPDDYIREGFDKAKAVNNNGVYSKWDSFEDYQKSGYIMKKSVGTVADLAENTLLAAFESYKSSTDMSLPFSTGTNEIVTNKGAAWRDQTGNDYKGYILDTNDPQYSGRFHVYSGLMVWEYRHRNEKFHGYLPAQERGNVNKDEQGDPIVYPIPMYFDHRDYFKAAYGKDMFAETDPAKKPLLTVCTHTRYRSHSTFNDSPLVRELGKASIGGGIALDTKQYADVLPDIVPNKGESAKLGRLDIVGQAGCGYERLWMSNEDADARGIKDGDLVKASNPIGAVHAVASVSHRIPKGVALLPQGGWYDPDPATGIDDGGCANTLAASYPTRCDHGNAQMNTLVIVEKA